MSERMAEFFDTRAMGYDDHMRVNIDNFEEFYTAVTSAIREDPGKKNVLDLGCGTGLELQGIFKQLPKAVVTCNDISLNMLEQLKQKYYEKSGQINFLIGSYTQVSFKMMSYDYVISVMTMHHLLPEPKLKLYRKIKDSLKPGGFYIEGDFVVNENEEQEYLENYLEKMKKNGGKESGEFHLDLPFTIEKQMKLLQQAGFAWVKLSWQKPYAAVFICSV